MPLIDVPYNRDSDTTPIDHTTKWMDTVILKKHAFLPVVKQIARHQMLNDVTTIALVGRESTGKTTLAKTLAHYLHKEISLEYSSFDTSDEVKTQISRGYCVRVLTADDFIDFKKTLQKLPIQNRILIFDDVSFMAAKHGAKKLQLLQNEFTTIRHVEGSVDLRTVVILNFHYQKALGPYLRDTNFRFHTSLMSNDFTALKDSVSDSKMLGTLRRFQKAHNKITNSGSVKFGIGKGKKKTRWVPYIYNEPFRLTCFVDGSSAKIKIYPRIQEIIDSCEICNYDSVLKKELVYSDIVEFLKLKFSETELNGAAKAMVIRKFGLSFRTKGTRDAYTVLDRLCVSGFTDDKKLLAEILKKKSNKNIIPKNKKRVNKIPMVLQNEFKEKFGSDCLSFTL